MAMKFSPVAVTVNSLKKISIFEKIGLADTRVDMRSD